MNKKGYENQNKKKNVFKEAKSFISLTSELILGVRFLLFQMRSSLKIVFQKNKINKKTSKNTEIKVEEIQQ